MTQEKTTPFVKEFSYMYRELNVQYEEYAKSLGLSYSALSSLRLIYEHSGECTQKSICEYTFLPKQTVNAIITAFLDRGIIKMSELGSDRRQKIIYLTDSGLEYAEKVISKILSAETRAVEQIEETQRAVLLEVTKLYTAHFREYMLDNDNQ